MPEPNWMKDVPLDKTVGQIMREYKTRLDSLGRPDENCANCEKHGWFEGKFVCRASKLVAHLSGFGNYCSEWEHEKDDGAWDPQ